jgi:hypothetical protein
MKKLLVLVGSVLGSSIGWWLGTPAGLMTSFLLSMVGLGAGMWLGARLARHIEG